MKKLMISIFLVLNITILPQSIKVGFLLPRQSSFWEDVALYAQGAANDLDIELMIYYADDNYIKLYEKAKEMVEGEDKVDVIVFNNYKNQAHRLIKLAEEANIKSVLFNSPMDIGMRDEMGNPGENYENWLFEVYPDELSTGKALLDLAMKKIDSPLEIIALNGQKLTGAALIREEVLRTYEENNPVSIKHLINIENWGRAEAKEVLTNFSSRKDSVNLIWTASHNLAKGAIDAVVEKPDSTLASTPLITYNFDSEIFGHIKSGKVIGTAGGHEVDGALVLIEVFDYFSGYNPRDMGYTQYTHMSIVDKDNVELFDTKLYKKTLNIDDVDQVDFRIFTRKYNEGLKEYDLTLERILLEMENK